MSQPQPERVGLIGELFWNIGDAILITERCRPVGWNPAAERLFGVSAAEATAPGFDLAEILGDAMEPFDALEWAGGRTRLYCSGRSKHVLDARCWLLPGYPTAAVTVLHDVTRDVRAANQLRRLNALARELLVETAIDAVVQRAVDEAATLLDATYAALVLLPGPDEEGEPSFVVNAPARVFDDALQRAGADLTALVGDSAAYRVADLHADPRVAGRLRGLPPVGPVLAVPLLVGDEVVGRVAVAHSEDETPFDSRDESLLAELAAHVALAVTLARTREQLRAEQQRRRDVADAARHDIRSPITVVRGQIGLIRNNLVRMRTSQVNAALDSVEAAVSRVETFATMLLVDETLQHAGVNPHPDEIDTAALVEAARADFVLVAAQRTVRVSAVLAPDTPQTFKADPAMVRQTLDNLLGNAIKFSPREGTVSLRARADGDNVQFLVTDRGAGIPENEQHALFQRFSRTESSRRNHVPGTGLGLSIVRRLVEAHGGKYGVDSRVGEGTTFWVSFPVSGPPATG